MKKFLSTEIIILASPELVWGILSDFEKYTEWNPFIGEVKGEVKIGNKISIKIIPTGSKGKKFKPRVISVIEKKEIRWLGSIVVKGLFDGEHILSLTDNGDGTTTFEQKENFSGILVRTFNTDSTKSGFEAMNRKLKELAESAEKQ